MWAPSWKWTPIGTNAREALDALVKRIRRGQPGQYLLTFDDIPFSPPADWPLPGSPWPLIEVKPKRKPNPTLRQLEKRKAALAKLDAAE
jgi:hypothetical protein